MPVSAIPDFLSALYTTGKSALPDATVTYGMAVTPGIGEWLMVGVDATEITASANSASSQQEVRVASTRHPRDESGSVTCAALSWNGDSNDEGQQAAVEGAFALAAALADAVRADPSLGLTTVGPYPFFVAEYGTGHQVITSQGKTGSAAWLIFTVSFSTRV